MGAIRVRVEAERAETAAPAPGVRGGAKEVAGRGGRGITDLVPLNTEELAASLRELTGELGKLFGDIRRVGGFELQQVQVGLEISAEGGFNLIGSAKAGGKGAITLTFAPGETAGA
jgi:hypothetical protein